MVGAPGLDGGLLSGADGAVMGGDTVEDEVDLGSIPLLETPPGEQPPPSPRLLGYSGAYGANGGYGPGYGNGYPAYGGGELVMLAGGAHVGVESLAQAAVILVIGVAIIISNIIVLATFITMPGRRPPGGSRPSLGRWAASPRRQALCRAATPSWLRSALALAAHSVLFPQLRQASFLSFQFLFINSFCSFI